MKKNSNLRAKFGVMAVLAGIGFASLTNNAHATFLLGGGEDYAILFQGAGGNHLQVTNVTVNGNIGVAGTGLFADGGPSTVTGRVDFADTVMSRFSSNNGSNTFNGGQHSPPYMGTFGVAAVQAAMDYMNATSQTLFGDAGTSVAISNGTVLNASAGALFTVNGQSVHVFDATSLNNGGNQTLTINGSASDLVAINLDGLGNVQFHGGIVLTGGLTFDNVIFNLGGGNYTNHTGAGSLDINNNGGNAGIARGIFLDPNGAMDVTNGVVFGRVFGGDSHDFQYVSGSTISIPEPSSLALLGLGGLAALGGLLRRRNR